MIRSAINCVAMLLAGCTVHSGHDLSTHLTDQAQAMSERTTGVEHFEFGDRSSSAWISDSFDGTKSRQFRGDTLHFTVQQHASDGGLDVGVSQTGFDVEPVSSAKSELYVCSSYSTDLVGPGRWWAGPKISVNWQGTESAKQNGDDWYENYIVEIASSSPEDLHALFTGDYFRAEELEPLHVSGATYRNYKIRFHDWWQFWSIRQTYRASGVLAIEPIVETWMAHGLPSDRSFDGVKANIETYGPIEGSGWLKISTAANPTQLECNER